MIILKSHSLNMLECLDSLVSLFLFISLILNALSYKKEEEIQSNSW